MLADSILPPPVAAADYCNAVDKIVSVILQPDSDPMILLDTILAAAVVVVAVMLMVEEAVEMLPQQFVVVVVVAVVPEKGAMIQYEVVAAPNYLE